MFIILLLLFLNMYQRDSEMIILQKQFKEKLVYLRGADEI
jgi:hypothetical protein